MNDARKRGYERMDDDTFHFANISVFQPVVSLKFAPSGLKDQPRV
jgi:hypothetical protein